MTWLPPPESERPDGFECLMKLSGALEETFWTHVMWQAPNDDEPEGVWMHWPASIEVMHDPIAFAPLPAERTDR